MIFGIIKTVVKKKTLEEELRDLEKLPTLPKEEQERVDKIASIMAEMVAGLIHGKHHKPVKRKK